MARKRSIFFHAVQSILRNRFRYQHRQKFAAFFLALFTLIFSLIIPAILANKVVGFESKLQPTLITSNALELEQQGKDYYDAGRFAEAAETWQKAADAYGKNEDEKNKNLINKAKALQSLGLYSEACDQVLKTFGNFNLTCKELINRNNNVLEDINSKEQNVLNKIIGLRLLGEILQRFGKLDLSKQILEISLQASKQNPQQKSESLLALGNLERARGNKKRDELDYDKILYTIEEKCESESNTYQQCQKIKKEVLGLYKPAFQHYEEAAKPQAKAELITQIQAELNQLSLRIEMQAWWDEQIEKHQDLLNRKIDTSRESKQRLDRILKTLSENKNYIQEELNTIVKVEDLLPKIKCHLSNLPQSRETVYAQINFTHNLIKLKSNTNKDDFSQQEIAKFLSNAIQQARSFGDKQAEAAALSNLARLYELQIPDREKLTKQEQLYLAQAKSFTQEAIKLYGDINVDNRQVLYRQRSQLGRILKAQGDIKAALVSYAEAWNILQSLRGDLVTNADNQFAFRQDVEPVYREFIDLLLQAEIGKIDVKNLVLLNNIPGADKSAKDETPKNPLDIARLVMESLQLAELDNFFQEPCSLPIAKPVQIDKIDKSRSTAVIYPIILEDRLEVIVSQSGQSHHYSQEIPKKEVKDTLEDLVNIIYKNEDSAIKIVITAKYKLELALNKQKILNLSQKIYNWLIPLKLKQQLIKENIKTLVFVLDRPFQKIPIAALYDGKNYLIEKYNIVLSLGQQLIQPKPLKPENIRILAAGVSKGGSARGHDFRELKGVRTELNKIKCISKNLGIPYDELRDELRDELPFKCINKNLGIPYDELRDELPYKNFNKKNLEEKIKSSPNVVHLATHGVFSSNREKTFILTGDKDSIGIDEFRNLLNPKDRIRSRNIELLILSACQTASGDERAALGIAGVVLRSGASSTIATLWNVSDDATALLMEEFYKNLTNREKKMSRAEALRSAQISLIRDEKHEHPLYKHPLYWAPFILAGNWI
ncbi:CHAT domain-containing protein [Scytonema hofmannii FACHB-248]|uniref:CHAT domain-containing protein n=1 Tax=Scytonema hofmannii FACHB-248 TaxID=1842502 RepID=A0ABR8H2G2_9CYAN|nr:MULTISPECIES: CHAT domain-containing protein [Nostocales]MBD2609425.1 CHAT domain-containing protein [Scytonema hofmannii FACHB-248]